MTFNNSKNKIKYSDLPSKVQAKIIRKSAREASEDQLNLVREFDKRFVKLQHAK